MALKPNQQKTGYPREDSPNTVSRTGRSDGTDLGQKKVGYDREDSGPIGGKTGRPDGFDQTQDNVGYLSEDSPPSKGSPSSEPTRTDEVESI